jgi:hypothetical protein
VSEVNSEELFNSREKAQEARKKRFVPYFLREVAPAFWNHFYITDGFGSIGGC